MKVGRRRLIPAGAVAGCPARQHCYRAVLPAAPGTAAPTHETAPRIGVFDTSGIPVSSHDARSAHSQPSPRAASGLTRSMAARRRRLREEAQRGNRNALRHGTFAEVANAADVALEVEVVYATHPALDPVADRRLARALGSLLCFRPGYVPEIDEPSEPAALH